MFKSSIVVFLLFFSLYSHALSKSQCTSLLERSSNASSKTEKILNQMNRLNSELTDMFFTLPQEEQNLSGLFYILKKEAWSFLPRGMVPFKNQPQLSPELKQRLLTLIQDKYKAKDLPSEKEIYIFYANSLQGRYLALSRLIRTEYFKERFPGIEKRELNFLEHVYEDFIDADVGQPDTEPERSWQALKEMESGNWNWSLLLKLAKKHNKEEIDSENSKKEWLDNQTLSEGLSDREKKAFVKHISLTTRPKKYCCKNTPGCLFCPNNRHFLK